LGISVSEACSPQGGGIYALSPLLKPGCGAMPERDNGSLPSSGKGKGKSPSQSLRFNESPLTGGGENSNKLRSFSEE